MNLIKLPNTKLCRKFVWHRLMSSNSELTTAISSVPRHDEEWAVLFKFQLDYRKTHRLTIPLFMKEFNIPEKLKGHLSAHKSAPTNNPSCGGYKIRELLKEAMSKVHNADLSPSFTLTGSQMAKKNRKSEHVKSIQIKEETPRKARSRVMKNVTRRRSATATRTRTKKSESANALVHVKPCLPQIHFETSAATEIDLELDDEEQQQQEESGLSVSEDEAEEEEEEVEEAVVVQRAVRPVRPVIVANAVKGKLIRFTNSATRPMRFQYICDKKDSALRGFAANLSFMGIEFGGNLQLEDNTMTSSMILNPSCHMDIAVKKFLHLTVTEVSNDHPAVYTHHKVTANSEVIICDTPFLLSG